MKLLEALAEAKETDIQELDALIGAKEREVDSLKAARKLILVKFAGKPQRSPTRAAAAVAGKSSTNDTPKGRPPLALTERRNAMLKLLLAGGPTRTPEICKALDIPGGGAISSCINHPWFQRTGGSAGDPMRISLTAEGRAAAQDLVRDDDEIP